MATIDKTKSKTYNFLSENKSIEDIKQQANIEVREKRRHGGITFRIDNGDHQLVNHDLSENNRENSETVSIISTNNKNIQEINSDIWTKFKNYLNWSTSNTEEISKLQTIIQELETENQQLKNEIEESKKSKQSNINFDKFKYNAITIYDEKQSKKTGIDKIYEEILFINNELYFITTIQNIDNSINEEVMHFLHFINGNIKVFKQNKQYDNIDDYKKDITLINEISINNNYQYVPIKDFLKQHEKLNKKPTKKEISIWIISWLIIPVVIATINVIHPPFLIITSIIGGIATFLRGGAELFLPTSKKVWSWFLYKLNKNKEQKEKDKKERQSIIKNLTSDELETKLQTQYDILKQELDNRKDMKPDKLISNNRINNNSNSILENSNIELKNNQNFDSSLKNSINHQKQQPSTSSNHNWNKVKYLFT